MNKKTVRDIDLKGKRVLMRVDFNVPMEEGAVTDDKRIKAALPTIQYVLDARGASLILMSHLGRPKGTGFDPEFSLKPASEALAKLLGKPVQMAPDCVGPEVEALAQALAARRRADAGEHALPQGRGEERPRARPNRWPRWAMSTSMTPSARPTAPTPRPRVSPATCRPSPAS